MGADDDADCVEHIWRTTGLHLSLVDGASSEDRCLRCGAVRYAPDTSRPT